MNYCELLIVLILIFGFISNSVLIGSKEDLVYFYNSTNNYDYLLGDIRRYKRQHIDNSVNCQIPTNLLHAKYKILGDSQGSYKAGDFVNEFKVLKIHCDEGYAISPFQHNISICINERWIPSPTTCIRTCTSLISTRTTTVKCQFNNKPLDNCINPIMGTIAMLSCNPLYEEPNIQRNPVRVCRESRWNPSISNCYPTCGNKHPKVNLNIVGGVYVKVGDYPWQIGLYNRTTKTLLCGGSIIEQNIILTAAHCVTDYEGNIQPVGTYLVAAGKYYSRYDEPRDVFAQYSNVLEIHVPERYTGIINSFSQDIAVIILLVPFTLSEAVQPVCIELNEDPSHLHFLREGNNGVVTGWGYTKETGAPSVILKGLIIPQIPFDKCSREVPESFRKYITVDKFCGGYLNNKTSICHGDSGGALVFRNLLNNRYFAKGIVSISPATEVLTCDSNQYSLYTSVDQHIAFVRSLVALNQYRTSIECFNDTCKNEETEERKGYGNTCELGPDDGVTCNCPAGYTGRRCDQCAVGYTGNPLIPGDSCQQGGSRCNSDGTQSEDATGRCNCKQNTDGFTCDQCKPNTFHLSTENQFGCIECFCMGITEQCTSSNWYRDSISSAFTNSINQFQLVESLRKDTPISQGIRLDQNTREIVYSEFSNQNQDVYYWALPSRYIGDKVATYGGNLQYSLRYVPMPGGQSFRNTAPDVELISGNDINLIYFGRDYPQPNSNQTITVPLLEQHWQRADGQKVYRQHLLMALADLKAVLIKATYTTNTREAALISVSLDIASERNNGRERALSVEHCQCPPGYRGLSCEDCDSGYTRSDGLYLGLCELCSCNGHSSECDPDDGNCLNCRDHTSGPNCEQCEPGYILDPITGQCRRNNNDRCECNPHGALSPFCENNHCQ